MIAAPWRRCRQLLLFGTWLRHRFDATWMGCFSTVACWAWFFGAAVLSRCEPGGATPPIEIWPVYPVSIFNPRAGRGDVYNPDNGARS